MSVTVERMTREQLTAAIGGPLEWAGVLFEALRASGGDVDKLELLKARTRFDSAPGAKTDGYAIVCDLPDGRCAGIALQLFGCASLNVWRPGELDRDVYDFCSRPAALGAGFRMVLGAEPSGWCRADRLCCSKREFRPEACGRGADCRFFGHRPEWER